MTVRVLEVAGVAAVERSLRRFDDLCARPLRLSHDGVDFLPRGDVVADGELERAWRLHGHAAVRREALAWPQRQLQPRLQIEECDGSVLELRADDALGAEAQTVSVERDRALEIIDPEREESDVRIHLPAGQASDGFFARYARAREDAVASSSGDSAS